MMTDLHRARTVEECEAEIERLLDLLEAAGHNSRGVHDVMGRVNDSDNSVKPLSAICI